MYRYVALIWNVANESATDAARKIAETLSALPGSWTQEVNERGLRVFHSGAGSHAGSCETLLLEGGAGAVCGRLFANHYDPASQGPTVSFTSTEIARLVSTGGRELIGHCWGRYVAVVRSASTDEVHVLRDPTGGLPCFVTNFAGVAIVFSDMESIHALDLIEFSINWRYIAAFVPYSALQIRDTGLNEVTEVQAGERMTFRAATVERQLLWSPLDALRSGVIENAGEATGMVRERVRRCVHAWAGRYQSIIHNLSGGLDSSIVLSCLMNAPSRPTVACLHYFAPQSREDERKYARMAAAHFNVELIEWALEANALELRRLLQIRRAPRPWFYIYDLEQGVIESSVAASRGATAVFSGASGDGLFLQARAELSVADYLRRHGLSFGVMHVALNAARISRTSMWPILRNGLFQHMRRAASHNFGGLEQVRTLIPPDVMAAAYLDDSLIHPWLADIGSIPPGLRWHIMCLSIPPAFYSAFDSEREVERTPALFSQPLIELCLRIPSYVWISGGRDRSLVREAFAPELPPAIVRRTQKGAIDRHNRRLMDENEEFLREMLLDGLLVKHGLLDRERLETFLSRDAAPLGYEYNEVLRQHLCTEVWLQRWASATSSSAP